MRRGTVNKYSQQCSLAMARRWASKHLSISTTSIAHNYLLMSLTSVGSCIYQNNEKKINDKSVSVSAKSKLSCRIYLYQLSTSSRRVTFFFSFGGFQNFTHRKKNTKIWVTLTTELDYIIFGPGYFAFSMQQRVHYDTAQRQQASYGRRHKMDPSLKQRYFGIGSIELIENRIN